MKPKDAERNEEHEMILIVEDDLDFHSFLVKELSRKYEVLSASNGRDGLKLARKYYPDLIVTDLMMPLMGGIEMCNELKSDVETSYILIIMLTARSSVESQLEGWQTGADDYVTKPFNLTLLQARIKNLLESRRQLRDRFNRELMQSHRPLSAQSEDDAFLNDAVSVLEEHAAVPEFTPDHFAELVNMSLSTLHRKLKALCGETPAKMIWNIRLKMAAGLLESTEHKVTDIAFMVGFTDSNHFSRLFKQYYEVTPSQYRERSGGPAA